MSNKTGFKLLIGAFGFATIGFFFGAEAHNNELFKSGITQENTYSVEGFSQQELDKFCIDNYLNSASRIKSDASLISMPSILKSISSVAKSDVEIYCHVDVKNTIFNNNGEAVTTNEEPNYFALIKGFTFHALSEQRFNSAMVEINANNKL